MNWLEPRLVFQSMILWLCVLWTAVSIYARDYGDAFVFGFIVVLSLGALLSRK